MASSPPRPQLMRKQSSQSSHSSATRANPSPASGGEHLVRQHVKPRAHAKMVLPRNHSSARNLVKMARQAQAPHMSVAVDESRKHHRNHSHEHDTEIRLPGSLDESRPAMRRNLTAYQLPRNASHAKLKKNLSHGQLTRLPSGKNLVALASAQQRVPTSPRMKGRQKRPKSAEIMLLDKNLQAREVEIEQHQSRQAGPSKSRAEDSKKVGFNVGNESDEDDSPEFEDTEQQEDEWTEESASASPYSTRQNTANNSRRPSVATDRPSVKSPPLPLLKKVNSGVQPHAQATQQASSTEKLAQQSRGAERDSISRESGPNFQQVEYEAAKQNENHEAAMGLKADAAHRAAQQLKAELTQPSSSKPVFDDDEEEEDDDDDSNSASDETASPSPPLHSGGFNGSTMNTTAAAAVPNANTQTLGQNEQALQPAERPVAISNLRQTSTQQVKEHVNPAVRRFTPQAPAPAIVSAVSALDDTHSSRGSPPPSLRSSKSNIAEGFGDRDPDELVSRFVASTSHPSTVSGANTAANTPKQTGFYGSDHSGRQTSGSHPTSPGSVVSSNSGTTTPAIGRSRTETRLMQQKALADREDLQTRELPTLPAWQYDRLNKSLKSSLNPTRLPTKDNPKGGLVFPGPEAFQGRFRVTNTELRVVQKFRDPIGESVARLRLVRGSKVQQRALAQKKTGTAMTPNRSSISVPSAQKASSSASVAKSGSPPYISSPLKRAATNGEQSVASLSNGRQRPKSQLDVARAPPQTRDFERVDERQPNENILRGLWNQCLEPNERSSFH